jgi:predicted PurR-regulated permease PerM
VTLRVAAFAALVWILLPFYGAILWAVILALLFAPLQRRMVIRLRQRRNLAALLTMLVMILVLVLPLAAVMAALAREAGTLLQALQSGTLDPVRSLRAGFEALPPGLTRAMARLGLIDFDDLQQRATRGLLQAGQFLATHAFSLGQNTFDGVISGCMMLYLAFFLIRDGHTLAAAARSAVPLPERHQQALFSKFAIVIQAVVRGNLVVAGTQGLLGGLAFAWLGVPGALLWAVLMAFLSLVPAVGAGLVWLPVAVYYLVSGQWGAGLALTAWGVGVIGLVDNVLRPLLVGKDTHMPDYVVLTSTLGGMAVFGLHGFVLGPTIAALFIAIWHLQVAPPGGADR